MIGDMVLYRMREGRSAGEQRPAIVVRWSAREGVSLRVFDAGIKDSGSELESSGFHGVVHGVIEGSGPGEFERGPGA